VAVLLLGSALFCSVLFHRHRYERVGRGHCRVYLSILGHAGWIVFSFSVVETSRRNHTHLSIIAAELVHLHAFCMDRLPESLVAGFHAMLVLLLMLMLMVISMLVGKSNAGL
jgi:hypothetical protein